MNRAHDADAAMGPPFQPAARELAIAAALGRDIDDHGTGRHLFRHSVVIRIGALRPGTAAVVITTSCSFRTAASNSRCRL